jgi:hypothetical protein
MKKRILAVLAASLAAMALAATASAAITITQAAAGPGYQNLSPFNCNGHVYSALGPPIRLQFGWGAKNSAEMTQFFKNSHGTVDISGTTTDGTPDAFHDQWADNPAGTPYLTQQGIRWSALESGTGTPPGGGGQVSVVASEYRGVLAISPGTYTLSQTYVFDKPVQDGFHSYQGTLSASCTFTVNP